ncbi:MAG: recombination protein RecR [Candidatus Kerfeldbacteria bacterium]|nr:recombination protein RecR [Candidatus Kerfeldbacteria bacterium]
MNTYPDSIKNAIAALCHLPGLGPKSAERLVFYLIKNGNGMADDLIKHLTAIKRDIQVCNICGNIATTNPCTLCTDPKRDQSTLCIVAEPQDIIIIEKTGDFRGRYHVLGGLLNPVDQITPEKLRIQQLVDRVKNNNPAFKEIIIATNPDLEGETTALYIKRQLQELSVVVTRLATGLPMGATIEYADEVTLSSAFKGRQRMN